MQNLVIDFHFHTPQTKPGLHCQSFASFLSLNDSESIIWLSVALYM